ncbi:MAG: hypothetical protein RLZZ232_2689 [Planctomycetota bacterium]
MNTRANNVEHAAAVRVSEPQSGHVAHKQVTVSPAGRTATILLLLTCALFSGCQEANHYYAEDTIFGRRLPDRYRVKRQANPQEVDLSKLSGAMGGSQVIGVGDVLEVQIAAGLNESDQSTTAVRVQQDGTINLQDIGLVEVAGVEAHAAEALIRSEAVKQDLYRNPTVTVIITFQKKNRVQVLGAVKNQGTYELPPNASDVVAALAAAGGLKENAGQFIEVRDPAGRMRPPSSEFVGDGGTPATTISATSGESGLVSSYRIDLIEAAKSGEGRYVVPDGGIVMVEQRDPAPIFVQGLVRTPNRYDLEIGKDTRLLDAISMAGGVSNQMADKIYVIRQEPGKQEPLLIQVSYRRAKRSADANITLGPGDVVVVEQTPGTVLMDALNIVRFGVTGSTTLF